MTQIKKDWAAQEVLNRTERAKDGQLLSQWSEPLVEGLDAKLTRFEQALSSFNWPTGTEHMFEARLVTGPAEAKGKLQGEVLPSGTATPEVKMLSGGFNANTPTSISAGTYGITLTLGNSAESLSVAVNAGDSWGAVLDRVKNAVNYASLPVRADVVYNNAAFQQNPDMAGTGSVLTLSVNPERSDQNLRVADSSGTLLSQLGMTAANNPIGPATEWEYNVTALQKALPTAFTSTAVDPRAATTLALGRHDFAYAVGDGDQQSSYISKAYTPGDTSTIAPGTYSFTSSYGGDTRNHSVTVQAGWTWGDVLRTVSGEINGQAAQVNSGGPTSTMVSATSTFDQQGVTARLEDSAIPSATTQGVSTAGKSLTVTGAAGQDFALTDGAGGLLGSLGLNAKLTGTTVSFNVQANSTWSDTFNDVSAALSDGMGHLNATLAPTALTSYAVTGMALRQEGLTLSLLQTNQRIGQRVVLSDGNSTPFSATGVISRETPGQDGKITVNGQTQVSENNTYSEDQGRMLIRVQDVFGDASIPLRVTQGMDEVQKSLSEVTDTYNDLAKYLHANRDIFRDSLRQSLDAPLSGKKKQLGWMGIGQSGRQGQLWTNLDAFWSSTAADPQRAEAIMWDKPNGLIPAWKSAVAGIRSEGLNNWLAPVSKFDEIRPRLTSEFQLEQKHRLVKLLG